jgi:predicted nucleic-acid-binding protein
MSEFILDTNVYISFLVDRNKEQREIAANFFKQLENREIKIFLPSLILAEIVYILDGLYEFPKIQIADTLSSILSEENLISEHKDILLTALDIFRSSSLDFADCYLLAFKENENYTLITFDKKLKNKS